MVCLCVCLWGCSCRVRACDLCFVSKVHLAIRAGCVVYATASTAAKHQLLLSLGVAEVFNSRSVTDFSQGVMRATIGKGVDVVLNSLAGEVQSNLLEASRGNPLVMVCSSAGGGFVCFLRKVPRAERESTSCSTPSLER